LSVCQNTLKILNHSLKKKQVIKDFWTLFLLKIDKVRITNIFTFLWRSTIELFILEVTVAILIYLPRIFPCVTICVPKTRIVKDNKRAKTFDSWRPSNREISEGFICIIKVLYKINNTIII